MKNKRFVALGDLIADFYYFENRLLAFDGGCTRYNVIANLSQFNQKCAVIGGCGNDKIGNTIIKRLNKLDIETSDIEFKNIFTRGFNLSIVKDKLPLISYKCSKNSPNSGESTWYDNSAEDISYFLDKVKKDDIIILDDLDEFSLAVINTFNNDKIIDIGNTKRMGLLKDNQLNELRNKFKIMQLNQRVIPYILRRINGTNLLDIRKFFMPELLIVTHDRNGAEFAFKDKIYEKKLLKVAEEIDPTGAGDAFLSVFVKEYYNKSKEIDEEFIDNSFMKATKLTYEVVQNVGGRGHIYGRKFDKGLNIKNNIDDGVDR